MPFPRSTSGATEPAHSHRLVVEAAGVDAAEGGAAAVGHDRQRRLAQVDRVPGGGARARVGVVARAAEASDASGLVRAPAIVARRRHERDRRDARGCGERDQREVVREQVGVVLAVGLDARDRDALALVAAGAREVVGVHEHVDVGAGGDGPVAVEHAVRGGEHERRRDDGAAAELRVVCRGLGLVEDPHDVGPLREVGRRPVHDAGAVPVAGGRGRRRGHEHGARDGDGSGEGRDDAKRQPGWTCRAHDVILPSGGRVHEDRPTRPPGSQSKMGPARQRESSGPNGILD